MWSAVCVQVYPHHYYTTISHGIWWQGLKILLPFSLALSLAHSFSSEDLFKRSRPSFFSFSYLTLHRLTSCLCLARRGVSLEPEQWTHRQSDTRTFMHMSTSRQGSLCQNSFQGGLVCKCQYIDLSLFMRFVCEVLSIFVCVQELKCVIRSWTM